MTNVWFITGAARGMGVDLAKAALDAGHRVVATARDAFKVTAALGEYENLLALSLDVTDAAASTAAVEAAVGRFGSIDVLVNNAGNFYAGYFEESLQYDVQPYGIRTTIVEPGFFRTELLVEGASSIWPELSIDDYAERTTQTIAAWKGMNGQQGGDPAKLGAALVTIAAMDTPPLRFVAGADVVAGVEQKAQLLLDQVNAHRELSSSMALENA
jgi:NAD(P)-dependent dehydrogenase (short-subunit alcohol dehydrogenase family)